MRIAAMHSTGAFWCPRTNQIDQGADKMNWDRIEGNWKQFRGKAKQQWGKLTDDQLDIIAGKREQLAGTIQEEYGISKDETEKQLNAFEKRYKDWDPRA